MNLKRIHTLAAGIVMLLGADSFALNPGWDNEGRITDVIVAAPNSIGTTSATVVFTVHWGTGAANWIIELSGETGRALLSQVYAAKTNGYWVQVTNDALPNLANYPRVSRLQLQQ